MYQMKKNSARDRIMDWLDEMYEKPMSWGELLEMQAKIEKLARRYGLVGELKNEGVL